MLNIIRRYFRFKVLLGAMLVALMSFVIILVILFSSKPEQDLTARVTAIVNIIPAPSLTPPIPVQAHTPTPTTTQDSVPSDGEVRVGTYVQVIGTSGTGLRLRTAPSLDAEIRLLGMEAEIFEVKEGPQSAEGYTWWYLNSPSDATRQGWAVGDYLVVVRNP